MGSQQPPKYKNQPPPQQLTFYSHGQHLLHGQIEVYTSRLLPMTFVMKLQRESSRSKLYNLFQNIQNHQSPSLTILYGFKIQRQQNFSTCQPHDKTIQFWQYLNYNLFQHIQDRSNRNVQFAHHQIWHVIQCVLTAINLLNKSELIWQVHPLSLEITPEGKVKCDWSHLELDNRHLRFRKGVQYGSATQNGGGAWWSPQEYMALQHRVSQPHFSHQASNIYKLGLIILAMTNLTPTPKLTSQSWTSLTKAKHPLPILADRCLNPNPQKRPTSQQLYHQYQQYFNSQFELMITQQKRQDYQQMEFRNTLLYRSKGIKHREINPGSMLSEYSKESVRGSKSLHQPVKSSFLSQFPLKSSYQQTRQETSHQTYEQRIQALQQYRKRLALSRKQVR